jgi:hypothetical protein
MQSSTYSRWILQSRFQGNLKGLWGVHRRDVDCFLLATKMFHVAELDVNVHITNDPSGHFHHARKEYYVLVIERLHPHPRGWGGLHLVRGNLKARRGMRRTSSTDFQESAYSAARVSQQMCTVAPLTSSRNLPFHSPHTSQLGNVPTWYRPPQSHGSASSTVCKKMGSGAGVRTRTRVPLADP